MSSALRIHAHRYIRDIEHLGTVKSTVDHSLFHKVFFGMESTRITVAEAKTRMARGETLVFLDSRNSQAWQAFDIKLPGAIHVPADEVEQHLPQILHDRTIIPYCT